MYKTIKRKSGEENLKSSLQKNKARPSMLIYEPWYSTTTINTQVKFT